MKKGDLLELEISGYAFEGKGICKVDNPSPEADPDKKYVVFVEGAYPGDVVSAQIRRKKKSYAEAKLVKLLKKSPDRIEAECSHAGICGGCKAQDLKYEVQLKYKSEQVKDIFERIGGFSNFEFNPAIPSPKIFFYRNKMEYSFAKYRWITQEEIDSGAEITDREFALGLHIPRMFDKILNIDQCYLQSEASNKILNISRKFFKEKECSIYSTRSHEGYLRHLVIKHSHHTNDLMVNLVTSEENPDLMAEYKDVLLAEVPEITTVVNNINTRKAMVAIGDYEIIYHGDGYIYDEIGDYKFRISPNSFFQTNTLQAKTLYSKALEYAELTGDEVVYDLYSGAGTISSFISSHAKEVYGFETIQPAVEDAFNNAKLNGIENMHFLLANLDKSFLPKMAEEGIPQPDVVIADPPRSGMNPKTVNDLLKLLPKKIVYVSCNPASQARDIQLLCEGGYKLTKMQPVDMFPHTYHIENVAQLVLQD